MPEYVRKIEDIHQKKELLPKKSKERGLKEDPLLKEYQKQAKERGVEELKNGDWMAVDGMTYSRWGFDQATYLKNTSPAAKRKRMDQLGTYSVMNGLIATVDSQGAMRIGLATQENLAALKSAHFTEGKFPVPFALGEQPVDEAQKKDLAELRQRGKEAILQEVRERHIAIFEEKAQQKGIRAVDGGVWMDADGITYETLSKTQSTIERNTDGYNINMRRIDQVGTYDANNGMLACVDERGVLRVGKMTEENVKALQNAGYRHDSLFVPFSNGERPVGDLLYHRLKDVRTGKQEDVREAARAMLVEQRIGERKLLFGDAAVIPDKEIVYNRVAYEGVSLERNVDSILEKKLQPKTEKDDGGFTRTVYTHSNVTFFFKGREEMPLTRTAAHSRTTVLGEAPQWVSEEKYAQYLRTAEMTRAQKNAPEHLVANKTLVGVIELAQKLGGADPSLEQMKQEVQKGVYGDRAIALIDTLIATNMNVCVGGEVSNTGEPLAVLALLGDADAQEALIREMDILRAARGHERYMGYKEAKEKSIPIQELACVHATHHKPNRRADGSYEIPTTFDVTNGRILRNSIHTALNHKVESHMYGSWENAPYTIVAPIDAMIQQNGLPEVLNSVDTWWLRNPGEQLAFPKAFMVKPAEEGFDRTIDVRGGEIVFKDRNFTPQDLVFMWGKMCAQGDFGRAISNMIYDSPYAFGLGEGKNPDGSLKWDSRAMQKALSDYFKNRMSDGIVPFLAQEGREQPAEFAERFRELLKMSGADEYIKGDAHMREKYTEEIISFIMKKMHDICYGTMSRIAVNEAITQLGCKVESGGMYGWSGSGSQERSDQLDALAYQLQLATGQHGHTPQGLLTFLYAKTFQIESRARGEPATFDWKQFQPNFGDLIGNLDEKSLRMLYASGFLVARENPQKKQKQAA